MVAESLRWPDSRESILKHRQVADLDVTDLVFFGPWIPRGPKIEKNQSRLKFSISLEKFEISLEIFNLGLLNSPTKIGGWWVARLKFSISLEIFNLGGRS